MLDLAGGTGSISLRLLDRLPDATAVVLDVDPALLEIAEHTVGRDDRIELVRADLRDPAWATGLTGRFDAVLTATALHWIDEERLGALYRELAGLVCEGGLFGNADHLPDPGLPGLSRQLGELADRRRQQAYDDGRAETWDSWWDRARSSAELGDTVAERDTVFPGTRHDRSKPTSDRHVELLRAAGFGEVGLVWRGGHDAAVVAVR